MPGSCSRSLVGLVVTAAASAGSYFLAIEPYRARGSVIGWVGASLAVAFAIRTLLVAFFDRPAYVFPDPLPFDRLGNDGFWHVGGATIQARSLFVAAVAFALAGAREQPAAAHALRARARGDRAGLRRGRPRRPAGRAPRRHRVRRSPVPGPASRRCSRRPRRRSTSDTAARYGLYGLLAAVVVWFEPRRAFVAGIALGLLQATVTSAHWGGGPRTATSCRCVRASCSSRGAHASPAEAVE